MKVKQRGNVPAKAFVKILKQYLEARENNDVPPDDRRASSHREALCVRCGMNPRMLTRLLSGEQEEITFDTADRILCGLGLVDYWWDEKPFKSYYYKADLSVPSRSAKWVPEVASTECLHCGAQFEYLLTKRERRYCSSRCKSLEGAKAGGEGKARGGRVARSLRPRGTSLPRGQFAPLESK